MERRKLLQIFLSETSVSIGALAEKTGVPRACIYKFLNGKDITLRTWERIEKGIPPKFLSAAEGTASELQK